MLDCIAAPRSLLLREEPKLVLPGSLLACSAAEVSPAHRELLGMRQLGQDRRGFWDHLKPKNFIRGVSRVMEVVEWRRWRRAQT